MPKTHRSLSQFQHASLLPVSRHQFVSGRIGIDEILARFDFTNERYSLKLVQLFLQSLTHARTDIHPLVMKCIECEYLNVLTFVCTRLSQSRRSKNWINSQVWWGNVGTEIYNKERHWWPPDYDLLVLNVLKPHVGNWRGVSYLCQDRHAAWFVKRLDHEIRERFWRESRGYFFRDYEIECVNRFQKRIRKRDQKRMSKLRIPQPMISPSERACENDEAINAL